VLASFAERTPYRTLVPPVSQLTFSHTGEHAWCQAPMCAWARTSLRLCAAPQLTPLSCCCRCAACAAPSNHAPRHPASRRPQCERAAAAAAAAAGPRRPRG
jgi:hypothetical protein